MSEGWEDDGGGGVLPGSSDCMEDEGGVGVRPVRDTSSSEFSIVSFEDIAQILSLKIKPDFLQSQICFTIITNNLRPIQNHVRC